MKILLCLGILVLFCLSNSQRTENVNLKLSWGRCKNLGTLLSPYHWHYPPISFVHWNDTDLLLEYHYNEHAYTYGISPISFIGLRYLWEASSRTNYGYVKLHHFHDWFIYDAKRLTINYPIAHKIIGSIREEYTMSIIVEHQLRYPNDKMPKYLNMEYFFRPHAYFFHDLLGRLFEEPFRYNDVNLYSLLPTESHYFFAYNGTSFIQPCDDAYWFLSYKVQDMKATLWYKMRDFILFYSGPAGNTAPPNYWAAGVRRLAFYVDYMANNGQYLAAPPNYNGGRMLEELNDEEDLDEDEYFDQLESIINQFDPNENHPLFHSFEDAWVELNEPYDPDEEDHQPFNLEEFLGGEDNYEEDIVDAP
jgi:hypothetical protein